MLSKGASLFDAQQQALKLLEGTVMKQAAMLAYNDAWLFILLSFLCVVPAVFILRRPKGRVTVDAH
jgi:DHA2 family multidrug resistance protein